MLQEYSQTKDNNYNKKRKPESASLQKNEYTGMQTLLLVLQGN